MKKMKKVGAVEDSSSPFAVHEDARTRFKHQSLMQDYLDLEKETETMKSKLQIMEQKKLALLAEVRFLRRRFKYLTEKQPMRMIKQSKRGNSQLQNHEIRSTNFLKGKKNSKNESVFRYPAASLDLNQKDMSFSAMGVASLLSSQRTAPIFDLNQKERALSAKEFRFQNLRPNFDLNQQERVHSGKKTAKRKNIQVFNLNQISEEEEELQDDHEPVKGLLQNANTDEQQHDLKLLVCRNVGAGPNRSGKRKITWQDQVVLTV